MQSTCILRDRTLNCNSEQNEVSKRRSRTSPRSISQLNVEIYDGYDEFERKLVPNQRDGKENNGPKLKSSGHPSSNDYSKKNCTRQVIPIEEDEESSFMSPLWALADAVRDVLCKSGNDHLKDSEETCYNKTHEEQRKHIFRHRISTDMNAQKQRVEYIMKGTEMIKTNIGHELRRSKSCGDLCEKSKEFNDQTQSSYDSYKESKRKPRRREGSEEDSDLEWFISCGRDYCSDTFEVVYSDISSTLPKMSNHFSPETTSQLDAQDMAYDSDLEHLARRHRRNRTVATINSNDQNKEVHVDSDEELLEEIKSQKIQLTWHLNEDQTITEKRSFSRCVAWIEFGSRLREQIIQPKFMWAISSQLEEYQNRPFFIDLLDICRIQCCDMHCELNKKIYPFARKHNCILIETTNGSSFVFEIQHQKRRQRILRGLKLLVAEIASRIASGYGYMEYFTPAGFIDENL